MVNTRKIRWWIVGLFLIAGILVCPENGRAAQKIFLKNGNTLECDSFFLGLKNRYLWYQKSFGLVAVPLMEVDVDKTFDENIKAILAKRFDYDSIDLARKFLDLSGLEKAIPMLGQSALSGLSAQQQKTQLPIAVYQRLLSLVKRSYGFLKIKGKLLEQIAENMDPLRAREVLEWLESPLGLRITALEENASTKTVERNRAAFAKNIRNDPPDPERLALYGRFEKAVGTAEAVADLITVSYEGIARGVNKTMPVDTRMDSETIERELANTRSAALDKYRESSKIDFLFTYRDLSDEELETYLAFAESKVGRWYHGMLFKSLNAVQSRVSEDMGEGIVEVIARTRTL
ncbi:MAG: hypothetical protein JRJ85_03310 [Deltaproteobacteria bacterium]|nr:hypothetical protein [Deltaproteobacteria bacterium]